MRQVTSLFRQTESFSLKFAHHEGADLLLPALVRRQILWQINGVVDERIDPYARDFCVGQQDGQ